MEDPLDNCGFVVLAFGLLLQKKTGGSGKTDGWIDGMGCGAPSVRIGVGGVYVPRLALDSEILLLG